MQFLTKSSAVLGLGVAVLALTGCGGSNSTSTVPSLVSGSASTSQSISQSASLPQSRPSSWMRGSNRDAAHIGVYVSAGQFRGLSEVLGYLGNNRNNNAAVCTITTGLQYPAGMATDAQGNLYVVSFQNATIFTYGPQCGSQTGSVIDSYGLAPRYIALDGTTWYVANRDSSGSVSQGNIAVCSASGCTGVLTLPVKASQTLQTTGVAVDRKGNVYASAFVNFSRNVLVKWAHGQMPGKFVGGYNQGSSYVAGALQFDKQGNLLSVEGSLGSAPSSLFVYSGCPSACTAHGPFTLQAGYPSDFKLNKANTKLFVANSQRGSAGGSVDVYTYNGTAGITYDYSITNGLGSVGAFGVALDPAAAP